MKERIRKIMQREQMTQTDFAQALGISPSSLSSIFNGHTSPTNNHVQAIHRRFPEISIEWLMFGEGDMMVSAEGNGTVSQAQDKGGADAKSQMQIQGDNSLFTDDGDAQAAVGDGAKTSPVIIREIVKYADKPQRRIIEIRVFYDDGTFDVFAGKQDR